MVTKINHVAIVTADLEQGKKFWVDALGLNLQNIEDVPEQEVRIAMLPVGDSRIELLDPTTDNSGVARYLRKRGPGLHHICLEVEDIEASLQDLRQAGIELIDESPRPGPEGKLLAFVHPRSTGGVLVELYQLPPKSTTS